MTRLFHVFASLLLLAAIAFHQWAPAPRPVELDPEARLIGVVTAAGLGYDGKRPFLEGGAEYAFSTSTCPAPLKIRLFRSIHRDAGRIQDALRVAKGRSFLIYRGQPLDGGVAALMARWALSKAAILSRLERPNPWDSAVLAVFPGHCPAPLVDWRGLMLSG